MARPFLSPWFRSRLFWALLAGTAGVLATCTIVQFGIVHRISGSPLTLWQIAWGAGGELLVIPIVGAAAVQAGYLVPLRIVPLRLRGLIRGLVIHLAIAFVVAVLAIILFTGWTLSTPPALLAAHLSPLDRFLTLLLGGGFQGMIVIYLSALGVELAVRAAREAQESRIRGAELRSELVQSRLEALRMQLRPHFLFNTLNAISTLALRDQSHDTVTMIQRLADLLRQTLDGDRPMIPLREELAFARSYLAIEDVRLGDRLAIEIDVEPETLDVPVPTFLLQPLLENAVQHGIARRLAGGSLTVRARRVDERLRLTITDRARRGASSPRRPDPSLAVSPEVSLEDRAQDPHEGRGLGLGTTRQRLALHYGDDHRLELRLDGDRAVSDSTSVDLDLPIHPPDPPPNEGLTEGPTETPVATGAEASVDPARTVA